jgi:shikimate kinase
MNLVLIGFTSTGKTATGLALTQHTHHYFIDLDDEIEQLHHHQRGHPLGCREIYSRYGRECFIDFEHQALRRLQPQRHCILATGGGAPMDSENRSLLKKFGYVVYLKAAPEQIFERMRHKGFPHFMQHDPTLEHLRQLWQQRHGIYEQMADTIIENSTLSAAQTAEAILKIPAWHVARQIDTD